MARIVLCEPSPEVLHLLERAVARLGHEPVACEPCPPVGRDGDALIVDPDDERALDCVRARRAHDPDLPVIVLSIYPQDPRTAGLRPVAHLLKPFTRADLERALHRALHGTLDAWPTGSAPTAPSAT